jgi:hypothetical protein
VKFTDSTLIAQSSPRRTPVVIAVQIIAPQSGSFHASLMI